MSTLSYVNGWNIYHCSSYYLLSSIPLGSSISQIINILSLLHTTSFKFESYIRQVFQGVQTCFYQGLKSNKQLLTFLKKLKNNMKDCMYVKEKRKVKLSSFSYLRQRKIIILIEIQRYQALSLDMLQPILAFSALYVTTYRYQTESMTNSLIRQCQLGEVNRLNSKGKFI